MKVVLLILSLLKISTAFEANIGACPPFQPLTAFDLSPNLTGKWYDYMKYPSMLFREKCIEIDVDANENAEITLFASGKNNHNEVLNETRHTVLEPFGSMEFKFSWLRFSFDFYLLDYEVDQYMIAYTCKNLFRNIANVQMVWIFTRDKELEEIYFERTMNVLKKFNISLTPLEKSNQENCD